jgi:hypothetical protein
MLGLLGLLDESVQESLWGELFGFLDLCSSNIGNLIICSDHPVLRNSSVPRLLLGISIGVGVGDILDPPDSVGSGVSASASASAVCDPLGRSRRWCWGVKGLVLRCGLAGFFVKAAYGGAVAVVAGHCLGVAL